MNISLLFLIQILIPIIFSFIASIYDLKYSIVPNILSWFLIVFGLGINLFFSIYFKSSKFILASIISCFITFIVAYLMWKLNIWGGGDVKLITSIATSIPLGPETRFLGFYPLLSFYPFSFTLIFNSILISFPFLIFLIFYLNYKNSFMKLDKFSLLNFLDYNNILLFLEGNFNKTIDIIDLEEGMIINPYYFDNYKILEAINHLDANLKVFKSSSNNGIFYFKSRSAGGITREDMNLLKIMYLQNLISNNISIKLAIPFVPSIFIGLIISIFCGDLIFIISSFLKNIFLVI